MRNAALIGQKIFPRDELVRAVNRWKLLGKKVVFTNGVFDVLHRGHLENLSTAAAEGDVLIVGLNTDASVKRLKGPERPIHDEAFRAWMMASLAIVDAVTLFDEDTPLELVKAITPDIIFKGGDYTPEQVIGGDHVVANGGEIRIVPIVEGYSTTNIIARIRNSKT